ncbi:MAG: hypothetical protein AB1742_06575 [bacterium]
MPYDSFLLDPFLLYASGVALVGVSSRALKWRWKWFLPAACAAVMAIFWVCSVSLYFDLPWIEWMWRMCGAESGRDWMINSGVFNFDYGNVSEAGHLLCGFMFALYPLWLKLGVDGGKVLFGRRAGQDGLIGALGTKASR